MAVISIIIPVYNSEKYIEECVKSVCAQTFSDLEIILIDDGSTDNSFKICENFAKNDMRIKLIHKENNGVSAARNTGIEAATGKHFGFVDSDDVIDSKMFERMLAAIEKNDADIAFCGYLSIKKSENLICEYMDSLEIMNRFDAMEKIFCSEDVKGFLWNKLFHTDIIKENNLLFDESLSYCEDLYFVHKYLSFCSKIVYDRSKMYYYRNGENFTNQDLTEKHFTIINAYDMILENEKNKKIKKFINDSFVMVCAGFRLKCAKSKMRKSAHWKQLKDILNKNLCGFLFRKNTFRRKIYVLCVFFAPRLSVKLLKNKSPLVN